MIERIRLPLVLFLLAAGGCSQADEPAQPVLDTSVNDQSEESEQLFFYVDGRKVIMQPTNQVFALKIDEEARLSEIQALSGTVEGLDVDQSLFAEQGLIILRTNPEFLSVPKMTSELELAPGQLQNTYVVDGIVELLQNEFLLQSDSDFDQQVLVENLIDKGFVVNSQSSLIGGLYSISAPSLSTMEAFESAMALPNELEGIEYVEPSLISISPAGVPVTPANGVSPAPAAVQEPQEGASLQTYPNDPYFASQWQLAGNEPAGIGLKGAWERTTGDANVIIAVLDEGIDLDHPDLQSKITNPTDATGQNRVQSTSIEPHGTACAGIMSATTNNAAGIAGISWDSKIMPVRIVRRSLPNRPWNVNRRIVAEGIRTAVDNGANVILGSWHSGGNQTVVNQSDYAISKNVTLVFASGNDGGPVRFPASLALGRDVIAVGASDAQGELVRATSGYGWASNHGEAITVLAPGVNITTTDNQGSSGLVATDYVGGFSGTSASAPHVAGAVALLLAAKSDATPGEIKEWISKSSRGSNMFAGDAGLLNIASALQLALDGST